MDGHQFDGLLRSLARGRSRRAVLGAMAGSALGGVAAAIGVGGVEAAPCRPLGSACSRDDICCTNNCAPIGSRGRKRCACPVGHNACAGGCSLAFSTFGKTANVSGGVLLVSDASPGYGGLDFATPTSFAFGDISVLATTFRFDADDSCKGGSPRFQLNTSDGHNVFVYLGPSPNFSGCVSEVTLDSGNLVGNNDRCRYDTSQIAAGTQCNTYAGTAALLAARGLSLTGIQLVADAGWAFGDGEQDVVVNPCIHLAGV
jgi:hypothetical protein